MEAIQSRKSMPNLYAELCEADQCVRQSEEGSQTQKDWMQAARNLRKAIRGHSRELIINLHVELLETGLRIRQSEEGSDIQIGWIHVESNLRKAIRSLRLTQP